MASDAVDIVENLAYLSKYLGESGARVRELETELSNVRRESPNHDTRMEILGLQAEKEMLKRELAHLKDELKVKNEDRDAAVRVKKESHDNMSPEVLRVKQESHDVMSPESPKPNTVLADTRQKHKDECVLREALQKKCTELEAQLKESAGMAAKTLRERLEAEKMGFLSCVILSGSMY
ncbi:hypothetical protein DFH08DRAFT_907097 [Mycena albidolilacea]|uniref:Uncharacterized protein n=1 Tax=Mycena albidolilacea TaxID=1033008 RepID=A0AAD7E6U2_9AGAR|nr:hypothetical protein DFH08DRAFT_907097 [Mycena albidolilacea]